MDAAKNSKDSSFKKVTEELSLRILIMRKTEKVDTASVNATMEFSLFPFTTKTEIL